MFRGGGWVQFFANHTFLGKWSHNDEFQVSEAMMRKDWALKEPRFSLCNFVIFLEMEFSKSRSIKSIDKEINRQEQKDLLDEVGLVGIQL